MRFEPESSDENDPDGGNCCEEIFGHFDFWVWKLGWKDDQILLRALMPSAVFILMGRAAGSVISTRMMPRVVAPFWMRRGEVRVPSGWTAKGMGTPPIWALSPESTALTSVPQETVMPPLRPTQSQVQGPDPRTEEGVPTEQRLVVGAETTATPLAEPQMPSRETAEVKVRPE